MSNNVPELLSFIQEGLLNASSLLLSGNTLYLQKISSFDFKENEKANYQNIKLIMEKLLLLNLNRLPLLEYLEVNIMPYMLSSNSTLRYLSIEVYFKVKYRVIRQDFKRWSLHSKEPNNRKAICKHN